MNTVPKQAPKALVGARVSGCSIIYNVSLSLPDKLLALLHTQDTHRKRLARVTWFWWFCPSWLTNPGEKPTPLTPSDLMSLKFPADCVTLQFHLLQCAFGLGFWPLYISMAKVKQFIGLNIYTHRRGGEYLWIAWAVQFLTFYGPSPRVSIPRFSEYHHFSLHFEHAILDSFEYSGLFRLCNKEEKECVLFGLSEGRDCY